VKKILVFLFLQGVISVALASSNITEPKASSPAALSFQQTLSTFLNPPQSRAIIVEEVQTGSTLEQNFNFSTFLYFEKKSASKAFFFTAPFSIKRNPSFFKNNLKRLLSQQIYPFHFYW
ncbi:MAG: hypothetical protein KDC91_09775, partial [Flavobacteriaceae bacterium]|nr:hypothetical protein [Flavobacteriaceae bacterium]